MEQITEVVQTAIQQAGTELDINMPTWSWVEEEEL